MTPKLLEVILTFHPSRHGCFAMALAVVLMATGGSTAPLARTLATMVSGDTTGLEVPATLIAGTGAGMGAMQLVINVHTDSHGNIEVFTN